MPSIADRASPAPSCILAAASSPSPNSSSMSIEPSDEPSSASSSMGVTSSASQPVEASLLDAQLMQRGRPGRTQIGDGDGDGDGGNPQVQAARRLYARLFDHNQDGRVSFDEFMDTVLGQNPDLGEDRAAALFDAVDADADQIISEEEFVDHWLATL
eukprot:m.376777 g.376777  ORF g.376777 m.376777 type:complete len:157 (-) comp20017_c10_seq9:104-574(-)